MSLERRPYSIIRGEERPKVLQMNDQSKCEFTFFFEMLNRYLCIGPRDSYTLGTVKPQRCKQIETSQCPFYFIFVLFHFNTPSKTIHHIPIHGIHLFLLNVMTERHNRQISVSSRSPIHSETPTNTDSEQEGSTSGKSNQAKTKTKTAFKKHLTHDHFDFMLDRLEWPGRYAGAVFLIEPGKVDSFSLSPY